MGLCFMFLFSLQPPRGSSAQSPARPLKPKQNIELLANCFTSRLIAYLVHLTTKSKSPGAR